MGNFDIQSARGALIKEGASPEDADKEIAAFLGQQYNFDTDSAYQAGASYADIVNHLSNENNIKTRKAQTVNLEDPTHFPESKTAKPMIPRVPEWGEKSPNLYAGAMTARNMLGVPLEFGLSAAGGVAGATANPLLAPVGGALGYAGAKSILRPTDVLLGLRRPMSVKEDIKETGKDVLEGMAAEATGGMTRAGNNIGRSALNRVFSKSKMTPEILERMKLAEKTGIDFTPADVRGTREMALLEKQLQMSMASANIAQESAAKRMGQFSTYARGQQAKIGRPLEKIDAGIKIQEVGKQRYKEFMEKAQALYQRIPVQPDTPVETNALKDIAIGYSDELGKLTNPALKRVLGVAEGSMESQMAIKPGNIIDATGQPFSGARLPTYSWKQLLDDRSSIGKMIKVTSDPNRRRILRDVVDAIDDDIASFSSSTNPEIQAAFGKAKAFYRAGDETTPGARIFRNKKIARMLESESPEQIVKQFIKPNNVSDVKRVVEVAGEPGRKAMAQAWTEDLFRLGEQQSLSPGKFSSAWHKYDDATLKAFLKPDEYAGLQELAKVSKMMGTAEKLAANPSGTAENVAPMLFAWNLVRHPYIMVPLLAGSNKFAKLYFNDPVFRSRMISGLKLSPTDAKTTQAAMKLLAMYGIDAQNREAEKSANKQLPIGD